MAITLNKYAIRCVEKELALGTITKNSNPRTSLYDMSRHWRDLLDASARKGENQQWSEREEAAMKVVLSAITYLQRIGCQDIEQLMRDTLFGK